MNGQISELTERAINGTISSAEWATLNELIASDDSACEYYATMTAIHAKLMRVHSEGSHAGLPQDAVSSATDAKPALATVGHHASDNRRRKFPNWLLLPVVLLIGFFIARLNFPASERPDQVAMPEHSPVENVPQIGTFFVNAADRNVSAEGSVSPQATPFSEGQTIDFSGSSADFTYDSGVTIAVSGAAKLRLFHDRCELSSGKAVVRVPPGAEGFRVITPQSSVTDYGTEFGVSVDFEGRSKVAVFDGEVGVDTSISNGETLIRQGEGFDIDPRGSMNRLIYVDDRTFTEFPLQNQSLITAVTDNVRDAGLLNFYRVARDHFRDDAPIYVDRDHQFNAARKSELPKYLSHAEVVMTFNDDKFDESYELTITLARAADLYVLFDARTPPPAWLTDEFERLPETVGVDEESVVGGSQQVGIGPGISVDNIFEVWRRRVSKGDVVLGHLGQTADGQLMYSVLACPID